MHMERKAEEAILISDEIDFKPKTVRDKEGHYIIRKGAIHQEDILFEIFMPIQENLNI